MPLYDRRGMGWLPDVPDYRDFSAKPPEITRLPDHVRLDLEPAMPPVYDQGNLGSCTANALGACVQFALQKQGLEEFMPSRLFVYYCERVLIDTVEYDSGAYIRDGAKVLHRIGVCDEETTWPYDVSRFTEKPPPPAYADAAETKTVSYGRVARRSMRQILAAGMPFTFGFTVYSNFYDIGDDGIMPMPDGDLEGGHAVVSVGYSKVNPRTGDPFPGGLHYRIRNSWGDDVEDGGYFWMPAAYLLNTHLSRDFWVINTVE